MFMLYACVLQFVGLAYMRVFVKFTILGPFFRVQLICNIGLYASVYGKYNAYFNKIR